MLSGHDNLDGNLYNDKHLLEVIAEDSKTWFVIEDPKSKRRTLISYSLPIDKILQKWNLVGIIPPFHPAFLGNIEFLKAHKTPFPYIVGEMANGIATAEMVIKSAKAGFVSIFGSGGLVPSVVEHNICLIAASLEKVDTDWGANLIHSPNEPAIESEVAKCFIEHNVPLVSASAYMELSPAIVHYSFLGTKTLPNGDIARKNRVIAKVSRPEVARLFMSPPPKEILSYLVQERKLSQEEAKLAENLPVAEDITVEADSGGHTDNRPSLVIFPIIKSLAQTINQKFSYKIPIRVGLAGGIGTPEAACAGFSMGADYILTGTVNQTTIEAGISSEAKKLLNLAQVSDVMMAAAADMFELGVKLQVLKFGTLFGVRANKLYTIYKSYRSLEEIPYEIKKDIENQIFKISLEQVWQETKAYFEQRDPKQVELAQQDEKYKMALVFRWYLGQSSRWAIQGDPTRKDDYQIWCGPCIGAFNAWVKNSYLEELSNRSVVDIAHHILYGAAMLHRIQHLRNLGVPIPSGWSLGKPSPLS